MGCGGAGARIFENEIGRIAVTSKENEPEGVPEFDDTNVEGLLFDDDAGRVSNFAAEDELDKESAEIDEEEVADTGKKGKGVGSKP